MGEDDTFATRDEALADVKAAANEIGLTEGDTIIACVGPPGCLFKGDEAALAGENGCPHCQREVMQKDGSWKRIDIRN